MDKDTQHSFLITGEELARAFKDFYTLNLRSVRYSQIPILVKILGAATHKSADICAGCEMGIKLGLLIASYRAEKSEQHGCQCGSSESSSTLTFGGKQTIRVCHRCGLLRS